MRIQSGFLRIVERVPEVLKAFGIFLTTSKSFIIRILVIVFLLFTTESVANPIIKKFEGFSPTAYICQGGALTIGYGMTCSKEYCSDLVLDEEYASKQLELYLEKYVNPELPNLWKNRKRIALQSLVYNIGVNAWKKSKLKQCVETKDDECIKKEWLKWNKVKGKENKGLKIRRSFELNYFYGEVKKV